MMHQLIHLLQLSGSLVKLLAGLADVHQDFLTLRALYLEGQVLEAVVRRGLFQILLSVLNHVHKLWAPCLSLVVVG